ncbi:MAG TPA: hypothetical protein PL180_05530 [Spirochaetota bacterium]|nr:hypothetical protein [Spirochaetota bacterium]
MSHPGESIKNAIKYLDSFCSDLGQMISTLERLLNEKGFQLFPDQGNTMTYQYQLTNHIQRNNGWVIKNVQRYFYLYVNDKQDKYDKILIYSISLYPESTFTIPVLSANVINFKSPAPLSDIWYYPLSRECTEVDYQKNNWRFKGPYTENIPSVTLLSKSNVKLADKKTPFSEIIDKNQVIFFDLIKIQNQEMVNEIVKQIFNLYNGDPIDLINNDVIITKFPKLLLDCWNQ